ncbi:hypothetical protein [Streptomyces alfalfae]
MAPTLLPRWSVTWPLRPNSTYSVWVRATDPTDAVRVALKRPDLPTYAMAFDYQPEVWRLRHPYPTRSYRAAGPDYGGAAGTADQFTPTPLDLTDIANQVRSTIRTAHEHGWPRAELQTALRPVLNHLLPSLKDRLVIAFAAETERIGTYTNTEL